MYVLDTCVLSEYRRKSPVAVRWIDTTDDALIHLSVITLGEVTKGIAQLQPKDAVAAISIGLWLEGVQAKYSDRILPVDSHVALVWGKLMAWRPRPVADALIAATAVANGKIVATRDVRDFADKGCEI